MRIKSVAFENFRQHRELSLQFEGPGSDFVVIHGENGEGKTNILNGILWCFYGSEGVSKDPGNKAQSLVSRALQDEVGEGAPATVRVLVSLEFSDGLRARVERSQEFEVGARSVRPKGKSQLSIVTSTATAADAQSVADPDLWLEQRFPERLRHYFLFDGEELDNFFNTTGAGRTVEDAVLQVTQVDLLLRVIERLRTIHSELSNEAGKQSGEGKVQTLNAELKSLQEEQQSIKDHIEEYERQERKYAEEYSDLERRLEKLIKDTDLRERFAASKAREKELEKQLLELKLEHALWVAREGVLALFEVPISTGLDFVKTKRERREVPAPIRPEALKGLLKEKICICGCALTKETDQWNRIQELLEKNKEIDASGEEILHFESALQGLNRSLSGINEKNRSYVDRIRTLQSEKLKNEESLEELEKIVAGTEDSGDELERLKGVKKAQQGNQDSLGNSRRNLVHIEEKIAAKRREFDAAMKKDSALQEIALQLEFIQELLELSEGIFDALSGEVREEAEQMLEREFKKMIWKEDYISSVTISDGFRVQVHDNRGFEILHSLSAGESACLAFAFALALNEVSGYEMPMLIDTPLGRMSPEVQTEVARSLAENTVERGGEPSQQVILLMTGTEYNSQVRDAIDSRNPLSMRLRFDSASSTSSVEEVA